MPHQVGHQPRKRSERADAQRHQQHRKESSAGGDRVVVAVAHRRSGAERPPQRIGRGGDVRIGIPGFEVENADAGNHDAGDHHEHHQGKQGIAPVLANASVQQPHGLDSPDHPDESGQPEEAEEADRGHRGGKVEQSPAKQVFQLVRGNHQIAQEVDEEDHADSQVEVGKEAKHLRLLIQNEQADHDDQRENRDQRDEQVIHHRVITNIH